MCHGLGSGIESALEIEDYKAHHVSSILESRESRGVLESRGSPGKAVPEEPGQRSGNREQHREDPPPSSAFLLAPLPNPSSPLSPTSLPAAKGPLPPIPRPPSPTHNVPTNPSPLGPHHPREGAYDIDEAGKEPHPSILRVLHYVSPLLLTAGVTIALLVESFELGTSESTHEAWASFAGMIIHLPTAAMVLSARFIVSGATVWQQVVILGAVAAICPVTVTVAALLLDDVGLLVLITHTLAIGVTVYLGATELLAEEAKELCEGHPRLSRAANFWLKYSLMLFGAVVSILLAQLEPKNSVG